MKAIYILSALLIISSIVRVSAQEKSCAEDVIATLKLLPLEQKIKVLGITPEDLSKFAQRERRTALSDLVQERPQASEPTLREKIAQYAARPEVRSAINSALGSLFGTSSENN